jgi:hypothetical protein
MVNIIKIYEMHDVLIRKFPEVVTECALIGNNLNKLTFPGQNPDRTLSQNLPSSTAAPSSISQTTVSPITTTSPPYQSTVTAPTSATSSALSTPVSSLGVRSAQSGMLGFVFVATMVALVVFF